MFATKWYPPERADALSTMTAIPNGVGSARNSAVDPKALNADALNVPSGVVATKVTTSPLSPLPAVLSNGWNVPVDRGFRFKAHGYK